MTIREAIEDEKLEFGGEWQITEELAKPVDVMDGLDNQAHIAWNSDCMMLLASATGQRIAVVVKIGDMPIQESQAGADISYGEGQSYIIVDRKRNYSLVASTNCESYTLSLLTRSNKLELYGVSHYKVNQDQVEETENE